MDQAGDRTHGTGCTFASALAAGLALGDSLPAAARRAQQYVAGAIAHGIAVGEARGFSITSGKITITAEIAENAETGRLQLSRPGLSGPAVSGPDKVRLT